MTGRDVFLIVCGFLGANCLIWGITSARAGLWSYAALFALAGGACYFMAFTLPRRR